MAKADVLSVARKVERVVTETVHEKTVTLTLTEDEAVAIAVLTGSTGGPIESELRLLTSSIYRALADKSLNYRNPKYDGLRDSLAATARVSE